MPSSGVSVLAARTSAAGPSCSHALPRRAPCPWPRRRRPLHPLLLRVLCSYTRLSSKLEEIFGMSYFLPTHQGRACEHILVRGGQRRAAPAAWRALPCSAGLAGRSTPAGLLCRP